MTVFLIELLVSVVMAATAVAYADGRARARLVVAMALVCVLVAYAFIFNPVLHAVYFDYDCSTAWWWEYYCW